MSGWRKSSRSMSNSHCVEVGGDWRKSSRSTHNGACVEVSGGWRKPSRSIGNLACVEAGSGPAGVLVRDTADRDGMVLRFGPGAWAEFLGNVKRRLIETENKLWVKRQKEMAKK